MRTVLKHWRIWLAALPFVLFGLGCLSIGLEATPISQANCDRVQLRMDEDQVGLILDWANALNRQASIAFCHSRHGILQNLSHRQTLPKHLAGNLRKQTMFRNEWRDCPPRHAFIMWFYGCISELDTL